MKLNVKIGEKTYSVEIEDLNARPILAVVDGERFEVTPQGTESEKPQAPSKPAARPTAASMEKELTAPLPGTIAEIFVKEGDAVESGQVLLVIEAMKMKNSIRSTRDGILASVLISVGQTVIHKQPLLEFK
jgi:biotin carboxyl carrier protein